MFILVIAAVVLLTAAVALYASAIAPGWVLIPTFIIFVAAALRAIWYSLHGLS